MKSKFSRQRKPWLRHSTPQKMYPFLQFSELKLHNIRITSTFNWVWGSQRRQDKFATWHDQSTLAFNLSLESVLLGMKDRLKLSITSSNWSTPCSQQFTVTWCTVQIKSWTFLRNSQSMSILKLRHQKKTVKIVCHGQRTFYNLWKWLNAKDRICWNLLQNTLIKSIRSKIS